MDLKPIPIDDPPPPDHLSPDARAWWAEIVAEYHLEAHQLAILEAAADALDRMRTARGIVLEEGVTVADRYGVPKQNPAVTVERDSRLAMLRAIRELGFDVPVPEPRPARRGGQRW